MNPDTQFLISPNFTTYISHQQKQKNLLIETIFRIAYSLSLCISLCDVFAKILQLDRRETIIFTKMTILTCMLLYIYEIILLLFL